MVRRLVPVLIALLLGGCAGGMHDGFDIGSRSGPASEAACAGETIDPQGVRLQLIEDLMGNGKYHAALAHLDATGLDTPRAQYLRAELLRQTDRAAEAVPLYRALLDGCLAGQANHGLGLIAGRERRYADALAHLTEARRRLPTDARVRNDLGYALLLGGDRKTARHELMTALDLDPGQPLAARNMVLLLLVTGEARTAQSMAEQLRIAPAELDGLRQEARGLPRYRPAPGAAAPAPKSKINVEPAAAKPGSDARASRKGAKTATRRVPTAKMGSKSQSSRIRYAKHSS